MLSTKIYIILLAVLVISCDHVQLSTSLKHQKVPTFPYTQEEITFRNPENGNRLSGTLTIPINGKVTKIVVLISGSGPQNRNEEVKGFKLQPFLVWSDWLNRNGIAVLRYDDCGVGKSTGVFDTATTADFADDVEGAVNYIHSRKDLKKLSIGFIGHSEGGLIAAIVASRNKTIKFICLLAGPGIPIHMLMDQEGQYRMRLSKTSAQDQELMLASMHEIYQTMRDNPRLDAAKLKVELNKVLYRNVKNYPPSLLHGKSADDFVKLSTTHLLSPWLRYFMLIDPADYLAKVKCPVLALNGSLDSLVEGTTNLAAIQNALHKARNNNHKEILLPGLNHLFQKAKTGIASEYSHTFESVSPEALGKVSTWINQLK